MISQLIGQTLGQNIIWATLIVGLVFVVFFLTGKKQKQPTKLSLKNSFQKKSYENQRGVQKSGPQGPIYQTDFTNVDPAESQIKNLNVIFIYNGHSFDAFEVLGLPAGSSLKQAEAVFQAQSKGVNAEKYDFLQSALTAIRLSQLKK